MSNEQRATHARVIRLKSPHNEVFLTTMLPVAGELETFLQLEATIRRKILAASLYGMESEVVEGAVDMEAELKAFAARLIEGDESLLDEEAGAGSGAFATGIWSAYAILALNLPQGRPEIVTGWP